MPASFEEFVVAVTPRLVRAARMLLGDRAEAEDLAQETLIVMHRRWRQLNAAEAAEAYALRTLIRAGRRQMRVSRLRHERLDAGDGSKFDRAGPDAPAENEQLLHALAALPPRQREVIVLRFYLDLSVVDTARVMRSSEGTVKSQTSKAIMALRRALDRHESSEAAP